MTEEGSWICTTLRTKIHTVFLTVGPQGCGKTTFIEDVLKPQLTRDASKQGARCRVLHVSSEEERHFLLDGAFTHRSEVQEVSEKAFSLVFEKLKAAMSMEVHAEFIVVDTTGQHANFRREVQELAKQHHYRVEILLFDYASVQDYYAQSTQRQTLAPQVRRFREQTLREVTRERYSALHRIKHRRLTEFQWVIENEQEYVACHVPEGPTYHIVGDIHECLDTLFALMRKQGAIIEHDVIVQVPSRTRWILCGDLLNKNQQTERTLQFLRRHLAHFDIVRGNHERRLYQLLTGNLQPTEEERQRYDAFSLLQERPDLVELFMEVYHQAKPFIRCRGNHSPSFYVTHAPCRSRFIGKLSEKAQTEQAESWQEGLPYLKDDANRHAPYHVFGHVHSAAPIRWLNKIGVDTACVQGYQLTSVHFEKGRPSFHSVASENRDKEAKVTVPTLYHRHEGPASPVSLHPMVQRKISGMAYHGVYYLSGTISPPEANVETGELESLSQALRYYADRGVERVSIQKKYMGSRATLYLFRDREQCYWTTRQGYRRLFEQPGEWDGRTALEQLHERLLPAMEDEQATLWIIDCEMLPWSALGRGLIDHTFRGVAAVAEETMRQWKRWGFEEVLEATKQLHQQEGTWQAHGMMPESAFIEQHSLHTHRAIRHLKAYESISWPTIDEQQRDIAAYRSELEWYGQTTDVAFMPFDVLKKVYEDGREDVYPGLPHERFETVSEDEALCFSLQDDWTEAEELYQKWIDEERLEGVMVKPDIPAADIQFAPMLKVRNPEYLRLVYGYDYQHPYRYPSILRTKKTRRKMNLSLKEFHLGRALLQIPYGTAINHPEYEALMAQLLHEQQEERQMDWRL